MESLNLEFKRWLSGYGSGYGSGDGDGDGSGDGSGSGYGYGSGSGDGSDYGYGYGGGYGDGSGDKLIMLEGKKVFYLDGMPFIPSKVKQNYAVGFSISARAFSKKPCFLGKFEGFIAHGETIKEAILAAQEKYFSEIDFEEKKKKLLEAFSEKEKMSVKELFYWHGVLTGSCTFGRKEFQKEHGLKDEELLTLNEFVKLTESSFGGEKIRSLLN